MFYVQSTVIIINTLLEIHKNDRVLTCVWGPLGLKVDLNAEYSEGFLGFINAKFENF